MFTLTGEYEHIIDDKNRLFVTSKLRSNIDVQKFGSDFYLMFGPNNILCLYPEMCFKQFVAVAAAKASAPNEAIAIERMLYAQSPRVEIDRQGRLLISEKIRKQANLRDHLTVTGTGDHLEIWNTADWQRYTVDNGPLYERLIEETRQTVFQRNSQQIKSENQYQEE